MTEVVVPIVNKEKTLAWLKAGVDGHTIFAPDHYYEAGLSKKFVKKYIRRHHSDGSYKGDIFKDGKIVESLTGVYELSILEGLCYALHVEHEEKMGRGTQARVCASALIKFLEEDNV